MPLQSDLDNCYMQTAISHAILSKANRKKVGACLVTQSGVIIPGYNGKPSGTDNSCEDSDNVTLPEVIHAELNCILKAAKEGVSVIGSTLYTTLSPCRSCSAMILQAGVKRVVYQENYRCLDGVKFLRENNCIVDYLGGWW